MTLDQLLAAISSRSDDDKRRIFDKLREEIFFHKLEDEFGIKAERVLDAIQRGSDLTKRGVRGVIAETIFATEIAPGLPDWSAADPLGDVPYDVLMTRNGIEIRIQVKMQRRENGAPLRRSATKKGSKDHFVVEVQKTRTGKGSDGSSTRPYRFTDFDLLAVSMAPSTGSWQKFLYVPTRALSSKKDLPELIDTMQLVPPYPADGSVSWTSSLSLALEEAARRKIEK